MDELVKVTTNEQGSQVVSARELHKALQVGRRFDKWIDKYMINSPYFAENEDYVTVSEKGHGENGRFTSNEYAVTLDTAKKLAMTVDSDIGDKVRDYFLQCEKKSSELVIPQTYAEALRLAAEKVEANEILKLEVIEKSEKIAEDALKVQIYEDLIDSDQLTSFDVACKALNIGLRKLYSFLRDNKILLKQKGDKYNMPYQCFIDRGYFEVKVKPYKNFYGFNGVKHKAYITGAGMIWLEKYLDENY